MAAQSSNKSTHSAGSGSMAGASSMAELMARHQKPLVTVNKGQELQGIVTKLTPSEVLLDINAKTEAVVLEKERKFIRAMMTLLKVGDTVTASVLNPESDTGNTVVSLRKFLDNKIWEKLAKIETNHEKMDVIIKGLTKGGYTVETIGGIDGFLPNSHVSFKQETQDLIGQTLPVMIAELHPETHKLIVSQKTILGVKDFDDLAKTVKVGQKISATIAHIASFGAFVSIPLKDKDNKETALDGFIHISEISWDKVIDITSLYAIGDVVDVVIVGYDSNAKRIDVSIKRLTKDPFEELLKQYTADKKVTGTVSRITDTGVIVELENDGIEGFIRKEKIPPTVKFQPGQKITMTVTQTDAKKHRVYLSPVLLEKPLTYR